MVVSLFGHKDAPNEVYPLLERKIAELAEQNSDITFLVGTHGHFDRMAQGALTQATEKYPHIECNIVLAYYDPTDTEGLEQYKLPTVLPEGIETVPKRYAIDRRNNFMVESCDTVICYITHDWGGAQKYVGKAERQGKTIINLAKASD